MEIVTCLVIKMNSNIYLLQGRQAHFHVTDNSAMFVYSCEAAAVTNTSLSTVSDELPHEELH